MANLYGPRIVTDGLVLHLDAGNRKSYPGSGNTWYDLSGNGYNGTFNGTTSFDSVTKSMSFDSAANTYISTAFNQNYSSLTMSCWFKAPTQDTDTGSGLRPIVMLGDFGTDGPIEISLIRPGVTGVTSGALKFGSGSDSDPYRYITGDSYSDDNWHNVVLVKNSNSGSIYIDGNSVITQTMDTNNVYDRSISLRIGGGTAITARRLLGKVSVVQFYSKNLSPSEVLQNYNALKGRFGL